MLKKETAGTAVNKTYKYYQKYREETERIKERSREYYSDDENPFLFDEEEFNEEYPAEWTDEDISGSYEEYLADRDYVYENMQGDPDWYSAIKAFFTGKAGLKSYHQLRAAHERFSAMTEAEQNAALQAAADKQLAGYFS